MKIYELHDKVEVGLIQFSKKSSKKALLRYMQKFHCVQSCKNKSIKMMNLFEEL